MGTLARPTARDPNGSALSNKELYRRQWNPQALNYLISEAVREVARKEQQPFELTILKD